ncbi:MAG: hypothetical protein EXS48_02235 [Candidatus Staskawiczbacteria bacterium]|nr:hypothetical protein [Candidatus Staskawiczbacteria bacterium]
MKIKNISLGIWMPRTSMHLREIYHFLSGDNAPIDGLDIKILAKFRQNLEVTDVHFIRETEADAIEASCKKVGIRISQEGIIVLELKKKAGEFSKEDIVLLENFFIKKFSPAIKYLFSLGAPLPKELQHIKEAYPIIITVDNCSKEELSQFTKEKGIVIYSESVSDTVDFLFGESISIVNVKNSSANIDWLMGDFVFLKEFPRQLANYLNVHRQIWEKIDTIRESKSIAYKNFSHLRDTINSFLKTLSLMKARINQMEDIILTKKEIRNPENLKELNQLKMNRIANLIGDVKYTQDLWEMTTDYTKDTLNFIESLAQENIQRELGALKFITLIAAITSFFGMNIAFPWEERWPFIFKSSFVVIGIIILISLLFYYFLKIFVYNRKFNIN